MGVLCTSIPWNRSLEGQIWMLCLLPLAMSAKCSEASFSVKAYSGSVEVCYFIINLLFVCSHPSELLTQIASNQGKDKK